MTTIEDRLRAKILERVDDMLEQLFETKEWEAFNLTIGSNIESIVTDSIFTVLRGMKDLEDYFHENDMINQQ